MSKKRLAIILFEIFFAIASGVILYILTVDFLGFGPSKIYSDKMTFWVTSLPPIGILIVLGIATCYLHKKQKKLADS